MSEPVYPITGAQCDTIFPRKDIRDLAKDPYEWSLFINALTRIQDKDYKYKGSSAPSWQEMGGIHGAPWKRWVGDPNASPDPVNPDKGDQDQWNGYCHHKSPLFPTWHRVVLLMVEQAISLEAIELAKGFASQSKTPKEAQLWKEAGQSLRFPFWDWTDPDTGDNGIPTLIMDPETTVLDPEAGPRTMTNPLSTYRLQGMNANFKNTPNYEAPVWFNDWTQTYRWPTNTTPHTEAQDQPVAIQEAFNKGATINVVDGDRVRQRELKPYHWLMQQVAQLFMLPKAKINEPQYFGNLWGVFSNNAVGQDGQAEPFKPYAGWSLEVPHNMVHMLVGGYGHMSDNDTAGFDPIFYLHHANVDRLYAFWAATYPNAWMDSKYMDEKGEMAPYVEPWGTFVLKDRSIVNNVTPLAPFRTIATGNPYYTSDDVRDQQNLKYTYPKIVVNLLAEPITVDINRQWTPEERALNHQALQSYFWSRAGLLQALENSSPTKPTTLLNPDPSNQGLLSNKYRNFSITVTANDWAYERSHSIELYIPASGGQPEVTVGAMPVLKRTTTANCPNCVRLQEAEVQVTGNIPLDPDVVTALLQRNNMNNEDTPEQKIIDMLKSSFHSRVVTAGRRVLVKGKHRTAEDPWTPIPMGDPKIPKLELYSAFYTIKHDTDEPHPSHYGNWQPHGSLEYSWGGVNP